MHDRGDYKSGWQIDKEYEKAAREKREAKLKGEDDSSSDEDGIQESDREEELPFACLICRREFERPVVTKCKHYFCESCAIKNFTRSSKCFACGAATSGIFTPAKEIIQMLAKKHSANPDDDRDES